MYGSSKASSKDTNLFIPSPFKQSEGEMQQKNREIIGSDLHQHHHRYQHLNSGLMRFCSAPSSLIANYLNGSGGEGEEECDDFLHPRSSSPETERVYARFMSCGGGGGDSEIREEKSPAVSANIRNSQFMASMEPESEVVPQQNGYSPASQMLYKTSPPLPMPSHSSASAANESSYKVVNSMAMDHGASQVKTATGNFSNLIRHSSSPAGFSSHLTVENGYGLMRGVGNFRTGNGTNGEGSPTTSRLKGQRNFSSGSPSSSGLMSQISENGSESIGANSPDDGSLGNSNGGNRCYIPGFPIGSWEDSAIVSENFNGLKRARDFEGKMIPGLNSSDTQNGESRNRLPVLSHHLSLPKTSMELADVEKFLQFPDSVPCKVRAKRGCATHPRSIAERVRRTRISERMRKLQELVPNMDKQTNTADMLDLAVDYIKDLQKQVKKHTDNQAYCTCSCKQKPFSSPAL